MKPYETVQELLEDSKIHGPYVKNTYNNAYYLITYIFPIDIDEDEEEFRIVLDSNQYTNLSPLNLMNYYIWQDGSPCGKSIEV